MAKEGKKATRWSARKVIHTAADIIGMQPVYFGETEEEKQKRLLERDKKKMREYTDPILIKRKNKRK